MVCRMSRIGVIAEVTHLLRAIQMPIGMPMSAQKTTATKVTISVSMLSVQ